MLDGSAKAPAPDVEATADNMERFKDANDGRWPTSQAELDRFLKGVGKAATVPFVRAGVVK